MSRENENLMWEAAVKQALRTLRYGSVELVVHDGRVIQIERREKIRFQDNRPEARLDASEAHYPPSPHGKAS